MTIGKAAQKLIAEMEQHGYHFDEIESHRGYYRFTTPWGATYFDTWKELKEYLDRVCWD